MLRGVLQYLGLIREADGSETTPLAVSMRHVDVIASIAYLAVALRIANAIDRAYQQTHSFACTRVAAFDAALVAIPSVCTVAIVTAIAHGLLAQHRRSALVG